MPEEVTKGYIVKGLGREIGKESITIKKIL
jgi:hypothetical protein